MIIIFQIIFVIFSLFAMYSVAQKKREGVLGPRGAGFWLLFWVAVIAVVVRPQAAAEAAKLFGIGRGADLVMYTGFVLMFFLLFRLHIKIEGLARGVTKLVREDALREVEKKDK